MIAWRRNKFGAKLKGQSQEGLPILDGGVVEHSTYFGEGGAANISGAINVVLRDG